MNPVALPRPVDRLIDVVNRNDTAAFLAMFPDDGSVDDWGICYVGHAAIKQWSDREFIGAQVRIGVVRVKQSGSKCSVWADVVSKGFNGPSLFVLVADGERIREMRIRSATAFLSLLLDLRRLITPSRR